MEIEGDPDELNRRTDQIFLDVYNRLRPDENNPQKLRLMLDNYDCQSRKVYDQFWAGADKKGRKTIVEKMKDDVAQMRAEEEGQRQLWIAAKNKHGNDYGNDAKT